MWYQIWASIFCISNGFMTRGHHLCQPHSFTVLSSLVARDISCRYCKNHKKVYSGSNVWKIIWFDLCLKEKPWIRSCSIKPVLEQFLEERFHQFSEWPNPMNNCFHEKKFLLIFRQNFPTPRIFPELTYAFSLLPIAKHISPPLL